MAFIAGYVMQNIHITLWVGIAGAALTFLIVVPPYPFYKRHPVKWLPAAGDKLDVEVDGKKVN